MPPRRVLCNAGPLIALGKLGRLDLLASLFGKVTIPSAVFDEVVTQGLARNADDAKAVDIFWRRHGWPVHKVSPETLATYRPRVALDRGETEVLALALTLHDPLLLLDDEAARGEARRLELQTRGTLGILVLARRSEHLEASAFEALIHEIAKRPDIWISEKLCASVLQQFR